MKNAFLKRLLSIGVCLALIPSCFAFAASGEVSTEIVTDFTIPEEKPDPLRYDPKAQYPVYSGYTPDYTMTSSEYEFFMEVFRLYIDTHLYEFDEDMLTEAFLMRLLSEYPLLRNMFLDTLLGTMDEFSAYYEEGTGLANDGSVKMYGISYGNETNSEIIRLGHTKPGVYVVDTVKGSKAEEAGLLSGDRIVSVEGISTEGLTVDAVGNLISYLPYVEDPVLDETTGETYIPNEPEFIITDELTGAKVYPLHIDIERNGEIIPVTLTRGRAIPSNISYVADVNKSYSYIKIASFSGDSDVEDFAAAIERAKKESRGNLLIDLRDNGGGRVDNAVNMANMLIPESGRILYYINSRDHETPEPVYSEGGGYAFDKVTVLVNEGTASASELMASILRYNCGAALVGTTTYGKAVGQIAYEMYDSPGDLIAITSFETLDPLKRSYHKIGLIPDIEIKPCMTKGEFPENIADLSFESFASVVEGANNEAVLAVEQRLALLDLMRPEYVDGVYDSVTASALISFNLYYMDGPVTELDERDASIFEKTTYKLRNNFHYYDSQLEVAEMTFSSRSQAKRRAKELINAEKKVLAEYNEYLKAEQEKIKAEEEAARREEEEAAKAESEQAPTDGTTEAPAETPAEGTTETPAETPAEGATETPAETPAEAPAENG